MSHKGSVLKCVGKTTDGKDVISGVFRFHETEGLPLDILFEALLLKNALPDWMLFYKEALASGMTPERIFAKLDPALCDIFGSEFRDVVLRKLRAL